MAQTSQDAATRSNTADVTATSPTALQVPELLEQVLLSLPLKQILLAQTVCRYWQACVRGSVSIQQALFLHPLGDRVVHLTREKESMPTHEWTPEMKVGQWSYVNRPERSVKPMINPLVPQILLTQFADYVAFLHYGFVEEKLDPQREHDKGIAKSGSQTPEQIEVLHKKAVSWRSMLVMQPPCTEISIRCTSQYLPVANGSGVTLLDVLTAIRKHYEDSKSFSSNHWIECWDVEGFTTKEVNVLIDADEGLDPNLTAVDLLAEMELMR